MELAYLMMEEKDDSRIQMIQFHQSYSYEDFIEGYRPKADGEGFELKQGPFVKFARRLLEILNVSISSLLMKSIIEIWVRFLGTHDVDWNR